jgi:hypothetical protein
MGANDAQGVVAPFGSEAKIAVLRFDQVALVEYLQDTGGLVASDVEGAGNALQGGLVTVQRRAVDVFEGVPICTRSVIWRRCQRRIRAASRREQ